MQFTLYIFIAVLAGSSYIVGAQQMLNNRYVPSTFSRVIWMLLAINSFAGIIASHGSTSSILLGGVALLGSIVICLISFWKGNNHIGRLEYICLGLLFISLIIWIFCRAPLLNLFISFFTHFVGALPTYKQVWLNPKSENTAFWSLFFFASVFSILATNTTTLTAIVYPIYYAVFDGSMFLLTLRNKKMFNLKS